MALPNQSNVAMPVWCPVRAARNEKERKTYRARTFVTLDIAHVTWIIHTSRYPRNSDNGEKEMKGADFFTRYCHISTFRLLPPHTHTDSALPLSFTLKFTFRESASVRWPRIAPNCLSPMTPSHTLHYYFFEPLLKVTPLVSLPKIEIKTGEEDETVLLEV